MEGLVLPPATPATPTIASAVAATPIAVFISTEFRVMRKSLSGCLLRERTPSARASSPAYVLALIAPEGWQSLAECSCLESSRPSQGGPGVRIPPPPLSWGGWRPRLAAEEGVLGLLQADTRLGAVLLDRADRVALGHQALDLG